MMTPAEREIAMKPLKKRKQQDEDEGIPPEASSSEDTIQPEPNRPTKTT